jgi:hypothetical protein
LPKVQRDDIDSQFEYEPERIVPSGVVYVLYEVCRRIGPFSSTGKESKVERRLSVPPSLSGQPLRHGQDVTQDFVRALLRNKMTAIRDRAPVHVFGYRLDHL